MENILEIVVYMEITNGKHLRKSDLHGNYYGKHFRKSGAFLHCPPEHSLTKCHNTSWGIGLEACFSVINK